jgi:thioredoxin type arsenate reductase
VTPKTVIFLCVANSARSQMAEGLARARAPEGWRVYSAGSNPGRLSAAAVEVMGEIGIDISAHYAKGMDAVPLEEADLIVTLCAEEVCPVVPGGKARRLHWPLPDPAAAAGDGPARLQAFRAVRDELARRIESLWAGQPEVGPSRPVPPPPGSSPGAK